MTEDHSPLNKTFCSLGCTRDTASSPLDAIDRGILYHLQEDAHQSLTDIADALDVAVNTVRNRIEKLENEGVIKGYTVDVDYSRADVQHHYLFFCTVRVNE